MSPKLVTSEEATGAVAALKGQLHFVLLLQVLGEELASTESQLAELAPVGTGTRVQTLVRFHVALLGKRLEAELALKWPLARMCAVVTLQCLLVNGRVVAETTVKSPHILWNCCSARGSAATSIHTCKGGTEVRALAKHRNNNRQLH